MDRFEYDLEVPVKAVSGVNSLDAKPLDSRVDVTRFQTELEYHLRPGGQWDPYIGMGAGYYLITSTGVSGNTVAGGAYQLDIKTPNTFGVTARIGSDWNLGSRFRIGIAASHSMTFKDYTVTDTVSGQQGKIRPFSPVGITAQLGYRF